MRAVVTRRGGGLAPADVPRPEVPPGGGLVRVSFCGLCGSDLEKYATASAAPGMVLGHEVVGRLERPGDDPVRVALAHHVPCGECDLCLSGHSSLCVRFKESALDPGGFAEELAVSAAHLADAVFPVPESVDDLTATLLEPLSCVLRAVEAGAGLLGAFPPPEVVGVSDRSPVVDAGNGAAAAGARAADPADDAGRRPHVVVAGCGSVGLLFLAVLAAAGRAGDRGGPSLAVSEGLWFMEPDEGRAALAQGLGARPWSVGAPSPRLAFVTAAAALPAVVEALAPGGVAVVFAGGTPSPPVDLDVVYRRELTLAGVRSGSPRHLRMALGVLASGDLPLDWYRPEVVDLAGLPAAALRYAQGKVLKVVARV